MNVLIDHVFTVRYLLLTCVEPVLLSLCITFAQTKWDLHYINLRYIPPHPLLWLSWRACWADLRTPSSHSSSSWWSTSSAPGLFELRLPCCIAAHPRSHFPPEHGTLGQLMDAHTCTRYEFMKVKVWYFTSPKKHVYCFSFNCGINLNSTNDPVGLTFEESQDLLHWSETTEALEAGESDGHLRLVVVVWIVLRKLSMETSS